jgi:type IV pilus assembly protein PilC
MLNNLFFRLSTKQKMFFARNLEVMIQSGMQILQSLEIIRKQTRSKAFNRILDRLIVDIKNGHFLSVGLERYRNIFGDFFINLVRVGETSGTLSENLKYLAEELKKKDELQKKVRGAMVYPIIILVATIGITSVLTFVIFPKILPVLQSINVGLPITTRIFVGISEFIFAYGVYLLGAMIALSVGFWFLIKIERFRYMWHQSLLKIPFVSDMAITVNLINFGRTMGVLLKAGIKIVEALDITADSLQNLVYRKKVREIAEGVKKGDPISKYLTADEHLFPPIFSQMVVVGENTGKLDESILFLSDFYESELDEATRSLSSIVEPLLLLVMGGVVGFVALAIITPIYKMTQTLGR